MESTVLMACLIQGESRRMGSRLCKKNKDFPTQDFILEINMQELIEYFINPRSFLLLTYLLFFLPRREKIPLARNDLIHVPQL